MTYSNGVIGDYIYRLASLSEERKKIEKEEKELKKYVKTFMKENNFKEAVGNHNSILKMVEKSRANIDKNKIMDVLGLDSESFKLQYTKTTTYDQLTARFKSDGD